MRARPRACRGASDALQPRHDRDDFNGIFAGLADGAYDAVISGITLTPERQAVTLFSDPYLEFNQALIVNRARTPELHLVDDLRGQLVGIQVGNTSDIVARRLRFRAMRDGWQVGGVV